MAEEKVIEKLERQDWLKPVENALQGTMRRVFEKGGKTGERIQNFLHGTWLGHPLHSALTDVPLGAWTTALVLDAAEAASGKPEFGTAADAAIAVGLAGAVGSAVTGLTDWQHVSGKTRRVGLIHGLTNVVGISFFTASFVARRRESRPAGRILSIAGMAAATAAAWLGGYLVYNRRIGVDHTAGQSFPTDFTPVLLEAELEDDRLRRVEVNGVGILLVRHQGTIHGLAENCTHMGGPLSQGKIVDGSVQCPWHGSRFDLQDGHVVKGPAVHPEPCFDARVRDGQIEVRLHRSGRAEEPRRERTA